MDSYSNGSSQNASVNLLTIYLRLHNGNGCSLKMTPENTLDDLILKIKSTNSFDIPEQFHLFYQGRTLDDLKSSTLSGLKIKNNSIIHVDSVRDSRGRKMMIDVCVMQGDEKFIIKSSTTDTILTLKQKIYKLNNISPKDQLLIFNGKKLSNNSTLRHYNIRTDSLICLVNLVSLESQSSYIGDLLKESIEMHFNKNNELLDSVTSLYEKRSTISKTTLFRSESIDKKNYEEIPIYEVPIHQENSSQSLSSKKEFNFNLFQNNNQRTSKLKLNQNFIQGLFESMEINGQNQDEEVGLNEDGEEKGLKEEDYGGELKQINLAESITQQGLVSFTNLMGKVKEAQKN